MNIRKLLVSIVVVLSSIILTQNIYGSHYAGAELQYRNLGGSSYEITLTFYRDCSGIDAPMTTNINFSCSSNPIFDFNVNINRFGSEVEVTNNCSQIPSSCGSGTAYGVEKFIYKGIITLPPCGEWLMYWKGAARNPLSNVNGTGDWYISAILNNSNQVNSNPTFNNYITPIAYVNELTTLDCGGIDPDGDSLSYSFYAPYANGPFNLQAIIYNIPFTGTDFLSSSSPITIDASTGIITFTADQAQTTAYAIKVEEWRNINGVITKIGESRRDYTLKVVSSLNTAPVLSGIDMSNLHTYFPNDTIFTINKCFDGIPIKFDVNGYDTDNYNPSNTGSPELFSIDWNNGISYATFTPYNSGTDHAYAEFYWMPFSMEKGAFYFTATVKDLACPFGGTNNYVYSINLIDNDISIGNDTTICYGESLHIEAESEYSFDSFTWSLNGQPLSSNPINNFIDIQASNLSTGLNILMLETASQADTNCNRERAIRITVLDQLNFSLGNDTTISNNETLLLSLPTGYPQYLWSNGSTANTLIVDNNFNWVNAIKGTVIDTMGCSFSDSLIVFIGNVGITSPENSEVKVYPNPIDDVINISFENEVKNAKLQLYDVNGKLVRSVEFSAKEFSLKGLSDLASGNYFIKIAYNNKEFKYPIIKK